MRKLLVATVSIALLWFAAVEWYGANSVSPVRTHSWQRELEDGRRWSYEGDLYRASLHYAQAGRLAAAENDWVGLVSVACRLHRLGALQGSGFSVYTLLVRAMVAAEKRESPEGLRAVADAFRAVGECYANLALSRIRVDWSEISTEAVAPPSTGDWNCLEQE